MTEQIKSALTKWAEKVLKNESNWETEQTHAAIQRLYEISVYYKLLQEEEVQNAKKWGRHQNELKAVLDALNPSEIEEKSAPEEEDLEVPPLMDTIKNMVTEMPETESYATLFENVADTPTFITKEEASSSETILEPKVGEEERKNINDIFAKTVSIDLNDRLSFIKHLFEEDVSAYERVLSQIVTFERWEEVELFIKQIVKPEYKNWSDKAAIEERFLTILQKNFSV